MEKFLSSFIVKSMGDRIMNIFLRLVNYPQYNTCLGPCCIDLGINPIDAKIFVRSFLHFIYLDEHVAKYWQCSRIVSFFFVAAKTHCYWNGTSKDCILVLVVIFTFFLNRLGGWIVGKIMSGIFGIVAVHRGELDLVRTALQTGLPVVFVPLHRSHLDPFIISWTLLESGLRPPLFLASHSLMQTPILR